MRWRQSLRASEYPVFALGGGKRVEVQQHVPRRLAAPVILEARAPPEPARMHRVLPEIIEKPAPPGNVRNLVRPVEERGQRIAVQRELRVPEARKRPRVLGFHPAKRAGAFDVFEPKMGIVIRVGWRGQCIVWRHSASRFRVQASDIWAGGACFLAAIGRRPVQSAGGLSANRDNSRHRRVMAARPYRYARRRY